jgi:hypothetical protein
MSYQKLQTKASGKKQLSNNNQTYRNTMNTASYMHASSPDCNTPMYSHFSQGYYGKLQWKDSMDSMDNTKLY